MRLRLVASRSGNLFMRELLDALAFELPAGTAEVVDGFGPIEDDVRWAWVPHEFLGTRPPGEHPTPAHLARTVALHTEQPGTVWSEQSIRAAGACGAAMDISAVGMVELRRAGLRPELLQLGWTAAWDRWGGTDTGPRPVDVTYLASANRRRDVHLAGTLPWLEPWSCRLHVAPVAPKTASGPAYRAGAEKHGLLASSRILLNIRSQIPPYFEWVRALEAICNGAVYVTEHGAGHAPLVVGEHLIAAAPQHLGAVCDGLLRDPERLEAIRDAAYAHVRAALPLRTGALRLLEVASSLPAAGAPAAAGTPAGAVTPAGAPSPPAAAPEPAPPDPPAEPALPGPRLPDFTDPAMEPPPGVGPAEDRIRAELRARTLELRAARRRIRALELAREGTDPEEVVTLHDSTREGQAPRVSVCVPLFDHAGHVGAALDSVLAQTAAADLELLVLDDASTDDGAAVVERRLAQAAVPARLLSRRVNAGLPAARNLLLAHARAPYALMLDADNVLFPHAAERLASALDADPAAAFAFGLVGIFRDERPDGLLSHYPWLPEQLPAFNWIDALALLRTRAVLDLGGFATDERLHGWEDYDLWCRVAETGGHGAHVPQPIGRYRRMMGSMVSLSDLDQGGMRELLAARHPRLFGRATAPAETPA